MAQSAGESAPLGPETIHAHAENRLALGDTSGALLEFERYLFYSNSANTPEIRLKMGLLYKKQKKYGQAVDQFSDGISYLSGDALYYRLRYEKGLCELLDGNNAAASREFLVVWNEAESDSVREQAGVLALIAKNNLYQWEGAEKLASEVFEGEDSFLQELNGEYERVKNARFKSRSTAILLSVLFPGTGQWYGGKFWRGLLSAFLILSFAGLTVLVAIWGRWILAFLTPFSLFQRFFGGGIKYADTLVRLHNQNLKLQQAKNLNEMILKKAGK